MSDFLKKIMQMKGFCSSGAMEMDRVLSFEKVIDVRFANDYKRVSLEFGCLSVSGHELTGICDSKRLSVADVTLNNRKRDSEVPHDWYVIEELHIDGVVAWQDSSGDIYLKSPTTKAKKICGSLCEYLEL